MAELDGTDDYFDSRDVISRIDELADNMAEGVDFGQEEHDELVALTALRDEAEPYIADWNHGETFVSDDYFEDYARELAQGLGYVSEAASWPNDHIDWEAAAEALLRDYTSFEFRGTTYWAR